MKRNVLFILIFILIIILSACIPFEKQSPLVTKEFLEGMPMILEFSRPVVKVEVFDGNKKIYDYNGDIIYDLKTNLILHNDLSIKITEFHRSRTYTDTIKVIEPDIQFLLYGGADNNLDIKYQDPVSGITDYFFDLDINEIRESIKKTSLNVIVSILGDRAAKEDEIIFISKFNGVYKELQYLPEELNFDSEISSASTETMLYFLNEIGVKNNNTIKIFDLWDHGNGWALESTKTAEILPKVIIQDDSTGGSYLRIHDIKDVLTEYNKDNSNFDILAFDACNMMSLEIIYSFKDLVDYIIGSVYSIAGFGFYYDFFNDLNAKNIEISLVYNIIDKYNYYYTKEYYIDRLSLTGVDIRAFSTVWNKINDVIGIKNGALYKNDINNYVAEPTNMMDINDLVLNTGEFLSDYVNPAIVNAVVRIDGKDYSDYSGVGIMFEDIFNEDIYNDYKALDFYDDFQQWIETTWRDIIKKH